MARNNKGRSPGKDAAPRNDYGIAHSTPLRGRVKALIVTAALWGVIPASFASWLIQRGGMRNA